MAAAERKSRKRKLGHMEQAVTDELVRVRKLDKDLASGPLAASALAMARTVDDLANSATSRSMCNRELRECLAELRELMPESREADGVDHLAARRAKRLAAA